MSPSSKLDVVRRSTILTGAVTLVLVVGSALQTVLRIDPFAALKQTSKGVDPNLGVRIDGVTLQSYEGEKLVTKATLDRMDIGQDRQQYELFGVKNGVFFSKQGRLEFDAPRAVWNVQAHELQAPFGGHVKGKDADLRVPQFSFNSKSGVLSTPGEVTGKLFKGEIKAKSVRYNINDESIRTGPIEWNGKLAISFQDAPQASSREWQIKSEGGFHTKGRDIYVYEKGYGTDGDIIVMADLIEHNRKSDIVTATGNVRYFSSKSNMVCKKAVIERKSKKATLTGEVQMLLKAKEKQDTISMEDGIPPYRPIVPDEIARERPPAPGEQGQTEEQKRLNDQIRSGKNMQDYPTVCYADQIVYWYAKGDRHAVITGKPQARQDLGDGAWRQVWTHTAYYNGETDRLKLVSSGAESWETRMINSIGDDLVAEWIDVSTKEGDDDFKGQRLKGTVMDYSDEIPRDESRPRTGRTPPPPTKGGNLKGKIERSL